MTKKHFKYVIIGAGPTGIGAAYRLKELGETDFCVLEKANYVGGLATSFTDAKGFLWDVGGHVQFSHYEYFDKAMQDAHSENDWLYHERQASALLEGKLIPYPVQYHIHHFS